MEIVWTCFALFHGARVMMTFWGGLNQLGEFEFGNLGWYIDTFMKE